MFYRFVQVSHPLSDFVTAHSTYKRYVCCFISPSYSLSTTLMAPENPDVQRTPSKPQSNEDEVEPKPVKITPTVQKTSSIPPIYSIDPVTGVRRRVNKQKLLIFRALILAELLDAMVQAGIDLVHKAIPLPEAWNIKAILEHLSAGPHALRIKQGKRWLWKKFPTYKKTDVCVEKRFAEFYEEIASAVHDYLRKFDPSEFSSHRYLQLEYSDLFFLS